MTKSRLYTRTGDDGTTALVGGSREMKTSPRIEAYGTVDELNSWIGLVACAPEISKADTELLGWVQMRLFDIGSYLACPEPEPGDEPMLRPGVGPGAMAPPLTGSTLPLHRPGALFSPEARFRRPMHRLHAAWPAEPSDASSHSTRRLRSTSPSDSLSTGSPTTSLSSDAISITSTAVRRYSGSETTPAIRLTTLENKKNAAYIAAYRTFFIILRPPEPPSARDSKSNNSKTTKYTHVLDTRTCFKA